FMNDDLWVANKHMTDFSKLMRLFLETSNDRHNLLVKEVQILTYYIELERMRLKSQFEIEFVIDDGIDQREVFLPSMLLQPIIENAILHGLRYKDENGSLTITIDQHNSGSLTIAVEDDGVGRKRSTEINAKRKGSHKSMASAIIYERVELLNSSSEDKIEMTIHDLEKDGKPAGTRVELNLDLEVNRET
ncbi:MAG: two-component system LytT family sensor kinase, partial [Bacteroidia bacterium]